MSLNDILQSIQKDTKEEMAKLHDEAKRKQEAIGNEWESKIANRKDQLLFEAQKKAANKYQQARFVIGAKKKASILKKKQEQIELVYEAAVKNLASIDLTQYATLLEKLVSVLPDTEGTISTVKDSEKRKILKSVIKNSKHTLSDDVVKDAGGFIFKSKTIEIDSTFTALVENVKEATQAEVAGVLFK